MNKHGSTFDVVLCKLIAASNSHVKRCPSALVHSVYVGFLVDQKLDNVAITYRRKENG